MQAITLRLLASWPLETLKGNLALSWWIKFNSALRYHFHLIAYSRVFGLIFSTNVICIVKDLIGSRNKPPQPPPSSPVECKAHKGKGLWFFPPHYYLLSTMKIQNYSFYSFLQTSMSSLSKHLLSTSCSIILDHEWIFLRSCHVPKA